MHLWEMEFFPPSGEKYSPIDALNDIKKANEKAIIMRHLDLIPDRESWDWPNVKKVQGIYQLTADNYRVYFDLSKRKIIICHICRKVSQKANPSDIRRAKNNFHDYLESIK